MVVVVGGVEGVLDVQLDDVKDACQYAQARVHNVQGESKHRRCEVRRNPLARRHLILGALVVGQRVCLGLAPANS